MNIKEYTVNSLSLSEKIINYNRNRKNKNSDENSEKKYKEILFELRLIIYLLPQTRFRLKEEDAAEFLLYMDPKLEGIIENYTYRSNDFLSYIYPILAKKIMSFRQKKYACQQKELALAKYHTLYDTILTELDNNEEMVAEEDYSLYSLPLRRLKFLCRNHPSTKKRLFVFVVSLSGLLSDDTLKKICNCFNFDFEETIDIMNRIIDLSPETERNQLQTERRNANYLRYLLEEMKTESDYSSVENPQHSEKIERYRNCAYNHNKIIGDRRKTPNKTTIAKVLGITQSYAGLATFYLKNILMYCLKEDCAQKSNNLGINPSLFSMLCNGSWEDSFEPDRESYFSPFKVFHIANKRTVQR